MGCVVCGFSSADVAFAHSAQMRTMAGNRLSLRSFHGLRDVFEDTSLVKSSCRFPGYRR